jgi:hypothetical protein
LAIEILISELEKNAQWYQKKGSSYKKLSIIIRAAYLAFFTAALVSMAVLGAGIATVSLGVMGAAAAGLDKLFSVTRNWSEFSYLEVKLGFTVAAMRYHATRNEPEKALQLFQDAAEKVEAETLGWQVDVTKGLAELKQLFENRIGTQSTPQ